MRQHLLEPNELGVAAERLTIRSYGEGENVCYLSNESCWSRNRRVYFRVTGR